jgi:chorismate mutase
MMDNFTTQLETYRHAIDAMDREILTLLARRLQVVEQVGALKAAHHKEGSYIRPAREANMLRELMQEGEAQGVPPLAIAAIWRIIIGASTAHESPLNIVTLEGDVRGYSMAEQYFSAVPPHHSVAEKGLWQAKCVNDHSVYVLPYDVDAKWWRTMPSEYKIFACVPFVGVAASSYVAIGKVSPEPTGMDVSLFYDPEKDKVVIVEGFVAEYNNLVWLGAFAM